MLRLGITGGIGSGKTTVCQIFKRIGIPVYEADLEAKILIENNLQLQSEIKKAFGIESFSKGKYNSAYIASIVFKDRAKLDLLNSIIHPFVLKDWALFCEKHKSSPYIVKEAAIMLETDSKNSIDQIVLVYSPLDLRIQRLLKRDDVSIEAIQARIASQMSEEEKLKLCDKVIYNDGKNSLIEQVQAIHNSIVKLQQ